MGFNVKFKSTLLPEDFPALQTLVGLGVGVDLQMLPLRSQTGEGLGTQRTPVRTLARMSAGVNGQQALGDETFPALSARVRSLSAVTPQVQLQLTGGEEGLPALCAQVVLLPSVHAHVSRQMLDGSLSAYVAPEAPLSRVDARVQLQVGRAPEASAAERAQKRRLARVNPVVDAQGGSGEVKLLTPVTLKRGPFVDGGDHILQGVAAKLRFFSALKRNLVIQKEVAFGCKKRTRLLDQMLLLDVLKKCRRLAVGVGAHGAAMQLKRL